MPWPGLRQAMDVGDGLEDTDDEEEVHLLSPNDDY